MRSKSESEFRVKDRIAKLRREKVALQRKLEEVEDLLEHLEASRIKHMEKLTGEVMK